MKCMVVLILFLGLTAAASVPTPLVGWPGGYHTAVGIPLAQQLQAHESSRIFGGSPAPLGSHPYLVGVVVTITTNQRSVCGSTLVSRTRAITAAHCWFDGWRQVDLFTLVMGSEYVFQGGLRVDTEDVVLHPQWDPIMLENDIAVINFDAIELTELIQPIALPSGSLLLEDFTGQITVASGYGMIRYDVPLQTNQVQSHVEMQVISNTECWNYYGEYIVNSTLCTTGVDGHIANVCSSDSGGPLSMEHDGERVLIGVTSFFSGFCGANAPNGFARITSFMPWISELL